MSLFNSNIYYFDISKIGRDFTGSKDIAILFNDQALLESVINILATEPGERIMYPDFGCSLAKYLFEPLDYITASSITSTIKYALNKFEPRIENLVVLAIPDQNENTYNIDVIFNLKIKNKEDIEKISIKLNKIR